MIHDDEMVNRKFYGQEDLMSKEEIKRYELQPILTCPRHEYVLLFGYSGYSDTPLRCVIGKWSDERMAWVTYSGQLFTDGGDAPQYWMPLPKEPERPLGGKDWLDNNIRLLTTKYAGEADKKWSEFVKEQYESYLANFK